MKLELEKNRQSLRAAIDKCNATCATVRERNGIVEAITAEKSSMAEKRAGLLADAVTDAEKLGLQIAGLDQTRVILDSRLGTAQKEMEAAQTTAGIGAYSVRVLAESLLQNWGTEVITLRRTYLLGIVAGYRPATDFGLMIGNIVQDSETFRGLNEVVYEFNARNTIDASVPGGPAFRPAQQWDHVLDILELAERVLTITAVDPETLKASAAPLAVKERSKAA